MKVTVENMKKLLLPGEDPMTALILTSPVMKEEREQRIAAYESGELQKEAERIKKEEIKGGEWFEQ